MTYETWLPILLVVSKPGAVARPGAHVRMALGNASDVVVGLGNDGDDVSFLGAVYRRPRRRNSLAPRQRQGAKQDSALEILRQRYARGEINKDEFEVKKKDLGG